MEKKQSNLYEAVTLGNSLGPVPERPISVNARLRFWTAFVFYIPMHCLHTFCLRTFCVSVSLLFLVVKAQQYFVTSSCMLLDEKTMLEIWHNPGLNLPIFRGTGPRWSLNRLCLLSKQQQRKNNNNSSSNNCCKLLTFISTTWLIHQVTEFLNLFWAAKKI